MTSDGAIKVPQTLERNGNTLILRFSHDIVDWINYEIPEKNWYFSPGTIRSSAKAARFDNGFLLSSTIAANNTHNTISLINHPLNLKTSDEEEVFKTLSGQAIDMTALFFADQYFNHASMTSGINLEQLLLSLCNKIIEQHDFENAYLHSVSGQLTYVGKNEIKTQWSLRAAFE